MKSRITVYNEKKFYRYMECLAIEMTRRCNLNCRFCAKGKAQNMDITHEIIDKTFDEMGEDVYLESLRISGGEPFLATEQIAYLIEKIISKHIHIKDVCMFTNGTHRAQELILPFKKLLDYLHSIQNEAVALHKWSENTHLEVYKGTEKSKLSIIISTHGHDTTDSEVQETIAFYQQKINDSDFAIVSQSDTFDNGLGRITLEGNAREYYRDLIESPCDLSKIRILDNNYAFVETTIAKDENDCLHDVTMVRKTLSISANGNVFPGCLMGYDRVDKEFMFNVMNCNNDFFDKVIDFCWEHPLDIKANTFRLEFKAIEFLLAHNIRVKDMTPKDRIIMCVLNDGVNQMEQIMKDMHRILPNLNFVEIQAVGFATVVLKMFEDNYDKNMILNFARLCADIGEDNIALLSPEWCRGFIKHMVDEDAARSAA